MQNPALSLRRIGLRVKMGKRPRVGDAKRESKFATKEMIVRAAWTACPIEEQGRVSANHHAGRARSDRSDVE